MTYTNDPWRPRRYTAEAAAAGYKPEDVLPELPAAPPLPPLPPVNPFANLDAIEPRLIAEVDKTIDPRRRAAVAMERARIASALGPARERLQAAHIEVYKLEEELNRL